MTLEILIITLELVLMASDSAVTVAGLKAFNGVQKIFALDENLGMGLMINGPSHFGGKSFEKIIEEFRCAEFNGRYSVENIKDNFISFLEAKSFDVDLDKMILYELNDFKRYLVHQLETIPPDEFDFFLDTMFTHEVFPFLKNLDISFDEILPDFVQNRDEVNEKLLEAFSYKLFVESTEIIIAGFDENSEYPSYVQFRIITKSDGNIVHEVINHETNIVEPVILSFGDDTEVKIFLNGIDLEMEEFIQDFHDFNLDFYLKNFIKFVHESKKLDEKTNLTIAGLADEFQKDRVVYSNDFKNEIYYWKSGRYLPMFDLTQSLPEDRLINFAINLINSTSFKKKYSLDVENVGGTVLIALINSNSIKFTDSEKVHQ